MSPESPASGSGAPESIDDQQTIAELRQANWDLSQSNEKLAEAVAARDAFLAVAAHELRNPMTPIVGRIQMLRSMIRRPDYKPEKIEQGLDQIDWLMTLYVKRANTLLDVSRVTTGMLRLDLAPLDVCGLAREVADSFKPIAEHAGSPIVLELPDEALEVIGDRLAVEQILDNLVSNAIKYGAGQPIALSAVASVEDGVAILYVRDGGPGISAEDQVRIFERFERAMRPGQKVSGFGVGLWIVRQLTDAMGGGVEVTSSPGSGSAFRVTLPLQPTRVSG